MSPSRYNVTKLNHCVVYTGTGTDGMSKFIMFGPDYSHFKKFNTLEDLYAYAEKHNLDLTFKDVV